MSRLLLAATMFAALNAPALAQNIGPTPGPGGIPLAPGSPVQTWNPGGIGPGGTQVSPGPAARGVPMYREGPGGGTLPLRPDEPGPSGRNGVGRVDPGLPGVAGVRRGLPQSLILTISSKNIEAGVAPAPDKTINSIDALFDALRNCWEPPGNNRAKPGTQMTVRFSYKRTGELMGPPRVTYTTPGTQPAVKDVYRNAITASLDRCGPMRFSKTFGAAVAGNPISIRYVDDRS
jgi:hypothetical protein